MTAAVEIYICNVLNVGPMWKCLLWFFRYRDWCLLLKKFLLSAAWKAHALRIPCNFFKCSFLVLRYQGCKFVCTRLAQNGRRRRSLRMGEDDTADLVSSHTSSEERTMLTRITFPKSMSESPSSQSSSSSSCSSLFGFFTFSIASFVVRLITSSRI